MKAGNLVGMGNHNQRLTDNHSNKDIDTERSYLNYDLVNRTDNYKTDIQQFINENKSSSRAVRKDAVLINEWIITSDNQFLKIKTIKKLKIFSNSRKITSLKSLVMRIFAMRKSIWTKQHRICI